MNKNFIYCQPQILDFKKDYMLTKIKLKKKKDLKSEKCEGREFPQSSIPHSHRAAVIRFHWDPLSRASGHCGTHTQISFPFFLPFSLLYSTPLFSHFINKISILHALCFHVIFVDIRFHTITLINF